MAVKSIKKSGSNRGIFFSVKKLMKCAIQGALKG